MSQILNATIKKVYVNDKKKDGSLYRTKTGQPFWRVTLDTHEHGKISNNIYDDMLIPEWQEGEVVPIEIEINNGYTNWKYPQNPDGSPMTSPKSKLQNNAMSPAGLEPSKPVDLTPPPPTEQYPNAENPRSPDWDKIAEGKVRHGVAIAFIGNGRVLNDQTKDEMEGWTNYIMTGQ